MRSLYRTIITIILLFTSVAEAQKDSSIVRSKQTANALIELREQLDDLFNDPNFSDANWGVVIKSLKTGEILYKKNPDKLFYPASDMKLFTTSAALLLLGSNYKYITQLFTNGELKDSTLNGDLILVGSGDPTISNRFTGGSSTKIFEDWADTLLSKGIKYINGNLVGDNSAFDNVGLGKGWPWDNLSDWFSAPSSAISFNDNTVEIDVFPSEVNFPAKVSIDPNTSYVKIIPKVITVAGNDKTKIQVTRQQGTGLITVAGKINVQEDKYIYHVAIEDPVMYTLTVLKETFEKKGISINGYITDIKNFHKRISYDNLLPLIKHFSVPVYEMIKETNKNSNNFYAEQLLKTIGLELFNYGSTENGVKACNELFKNMGINPDNMVMADGSGLSRLNLVTPRQIVNLLSYMYKTNEFEKFYASLPIAGVDGTLVNRMRKTNAENNVRAKGGYNIATSSLSGYLRTTAGEPIAFSMIVNNYLVPTTLAIYVQDNACQRLINFNRN
ncbi:D-alanyl-D-alanine carboxypeptidase/D-alanyl-D-alanine-endopeptidase [Melioribacteraceae bacterium 4301-Me]|uniref:D-alanyl-D-alanine carboxypeptidase/D-alanyl-D-alanine endopeptidase n=1 Tax=Pyranulibacter aquaticus TaxID=3163344 RepID=UPI00359BC2F2